MTTIASPESGPATAGSPFITSHRTQVRANASARLRAWIATATMPGWLARFLSVPLTAKLTGANLTIVIAALGAALFTNRGEPEDGRLLLVMTTALGLSLIVGVGLVIAALRPLRDLEQTAERVSRGDFRARVPASMLADRNIARIGGTLNRVLDSLVADRTRARRLACEVIRAGDRQRAHIGRELSESTAQLLAALKFETAALVEACDDPELKHRLDAVRCLTADALESVGALAQTVHPRILDDLGLVVALKGLARRTSQHASVDVTVHADAAIGPLSDAAAAMLYRVAEEAVANAVHHGWAEHVSLNLAGTAAGIEFTVGDDGRGFDIDAARAEPGIGLFMMQERASLAGGRFSIKSGATTGTTITVFLPLKQGWSS